jgi:hypothetical protein
MTLDSAPCIGSFKSVLKFDFGKKLFTLPAILIFLKIKKSWKTNICIPTRKFTTKQKNVVTANEGAIKSMSKKRHCTFHNSILFAPTIVRCNGEQRNKAISVSAVRMHPKLWNYCLTQFSSNSNTHWNNSLKRAAYFFSSLTEMKAQWGGGIQHHPGYVIPDVGKPDRSLSYYKPPLIYRQNDFFHWFTVVNVPKTTLEVGRNYTLLTIPVDSYRIKSTHTRILYQ